MRRPTKNESDKTNRRLIFNRHLHFLFVCWLFRITEIIFHALTQLCNHIVLACTPLILQYTIMPLQQRETHSSFDVRAHEESTSSTTTVRATSHTIHNTLCTIRYFHEIPRARSARLSLMQSIIITTRSRLCQRDAHCDILLMEIVSYGHTACWCQLSTAQCDFLFALICAINFFFVCVLQQQRHCNCITRSQHALNISKSACWSHGINVGVCVLAADCARLADIRAML